MILSLFQRVVWPVFGLFLLSACVTDSDGEISNPVERRLSWIDFISAGDIRRGCEQDGRDRIRFVLNADRSKQVRVYDFSPSEKTLRIRVLSPRVSISEIPLNADIVDFYDPTDDLVRLSDDAATAIETAFKHDLGAERSKLPDELLTEWFFWLVGSCTNGEFRFDAWLHPDSDFQALNFPAELQQRDVSTVGFVQLPPGPRLSKRDYNPERQQGFAHYVLHMRDTGVVIGQNYGQDQTQ